MNGNNGESATFGFNTPSTKDKPVDANNTAPENEAPVETFEENKELEEEYFDSRSITISLVTNYSLYRKKNDKVLPKRKDYIGSCIRSSRVLSANKGEVEAYFPNILGISPNNELFVTRVKQYLNNIRIGVDELGKTFDISFVYEHKRDYLEIVKKEEAIEAKYAKADRSNTDILEKALITKIDELNALESSKYKVGRPVNVEDYLMYRHCLLYNDIAKDIAFINSNPNIRFYFKDDRKEAERLKKYRLEVNKAKTNYVACLADDELFNAIYIKYLSDSNMSIIAGMEEDEVTRQIKLDKFSTEDPVKFNKMFSDKDIKLIGNIEMLIARGELIRYPNNQNITAVDGTFIGANLKEAIAWFKNGDNANIVRNYFNKLNNI